MRRRLAVAVVVVTALVGEWLGHGINYYRVADTAGLRAGLGGGIHDYMLPLAALLLGLAAVAATSLLRAWLAFGHRLDRASRALRRLRRGDLRGVHPAARRVTPPAAPVTTPSTAARFVALSLLLTALQCAIYVAQENLERSLRGIAAPGLGPLLDGGGAAAWIQMAVALLLGAILTGALLLLRRRHRTVQRIERLVNAFWRRFTRDQRLPAPPQPHVTATQLLLRSALWQRPPPACFTV